MEGDKKADQAQKAGITHKKGLFLPSVHVCSVVVFAALAIYDQRAGVKRIEQRRELRTKQIQSGDREVSYFLSACD